MVACDLIVTLHYAVTSQYILIGTKSFEDFSNGASKICQFVFGGKDVH